MAHFYGSMRGGRQEVTRTGHKTTGLNCHIRGWNVGIKAQARVGSSGRDECVATLTGGSNNPCQWGIEIISDGQTASIGVRNAKGDWLILPLVNAGTPGTWKLDTRSGGSNV